MKQPRVRHRRRGMVRAALSVGVLLGLGAVNTLAYWTDEGSAVTGPLQAGRLDVTLNGQLTGPGGTTTDAAFAIGDLVPGESFARVITVGNAGSVPLDYTVGASTSGALGAGLRWTVVVGGSPGNTGTVTGGNRVGTCTGGTTTFSGTSAISTTPSAPTPVVATRRPLAVAGTEALCVVVRLDAAATSALQGATATATFAVAAVQRGAP